MRYRAVVSVMPKPGISDPEGKAIKDASNQLGHEGVLKVASGRVYVLETESRDIASATELANRLAGELLSNPIIQSYELTRVEEIQ